MKHGTLRCALLVICLWPLVASGQGLTDAGRPQVIRKTEEFRYDGGPLPDFMSKLQTEFGIDPDRFRPVGPRLLRSVSVPRLEMMAASYIDVLNRYNELGEKDPRIGRWLLPGVTPGIAPDKQIYFVREAVRRNGRFEFDGGSLHDLISAIYLQFGVDLGEVGTIPNSVDQFAVEVPKIRLRSDDYTDVLELYNEISTESDHSMGRWIVKKKRDEVSTVVLVPPSNSPGENQISTRAFPFTLNDPDTLNRLRELIETQAAVVANLRRSTTRARGHIAYHEGTGILVVTGTPAFLELASEIIGASRDKVGAGAPAPSLKKP